MDPSGNLDVTHFVAFMAILAGIVHIIGAINLHTPQACTAPAQEAVRSEGHNRSEDRERSPTVNERTALLRPNNTRLEEQQTVRDLLGDPYFLLLGVLVLVALGSVRAQSLYILTAVLTRPLISVKW